MELIDSAADVRPGEHLDIFNLDLYLKSVLTGLQGKLQVKQFPGGASNLTYLIQYSNQEMVLRRPPIGHKAKSAHDMRREARVLNTLKPFYPYLPEVLHQCDDQSVMGCEFFVMERLKGVIPRCNLPSEFSSNRSKVRALCLGGLDKLIELHKVDASHPQMQSLGRGVGYVERQIKGWCERYIKAKTEDAASFEVVMRWLSENTPAFTKICVIHNDFRFDNLVFNPDNLGQVIGVLDWEMATLGDPLMDLGNSLAYWVEASDPEPLLNARVQPTHLNGMLSRAEVVDYYLSKTGMQIDSFNFYEIAGLFRLAAIVQQIYYRYFHGQTQDKRFANFGGFAAYLEQRCLNLINKG